MRTVSRKLQGHYNYYGINGNSYSITKYYYQITSLLFKWLNRRSQKNSHTLTTYNQMLRNYEIPTPEIKKLIYAI